MAYDDDPFYDINARADYMREAYGDPCPSCGTLRWQADCPKCYKEELEGEAPVLDTLVPDAVPVREWDDDDIPF